MKREVLMQFFLSNEMGERQPDPASNTTPDGTHAN